MTNLPSHDLEGILARQKSYVYPCVVVMLLYCFLWVPGVIANWLFLKDAQRMETMAGESLPGVWWLRFMWTITSVLALLIFLFVVIAIIGSCQPH